MAVVKVMENWRRGGQNHHVVVAVEDKDFLDAIDELVENMPPQLSSMVKRWGPFKVRVRRTGRRR